MSDPLRSGLIRLAHIHPELRPHLLPLLKEAARGVDPEELAGVYNGVTDVLRRAWSTLHGLRGEVPRGGFAEQSLVRATSAVADALSQVREEQDRTENGDYPGPF